MEANIKLFLDDLKRTYKRSQEGTKGLIDMHGLGDKDPLTLKFSAREEVIGDVLDSLFDAGLLTKKEVTEQAKLFVVEI